MSPDEAPDEGGGIQHLLDALRLAVFPEGAICTGWVLVTEWVASDGEHYTYCAKDDHNPPWRHEGLLAYVLNEGLDVDDGDDD